MLDAFRVEVLGYWERRRIFYNLLLIPPAWLAWELSGGFTVAIDDRLPASLADSYVIRSTFLLWLGANVCYSVVYLLEVVLASERRRPWWPKVGRTMVFAAGCAIGMALAASNASALQTRARGEWIAAPSN